MDSRTHISQIFPELNEIQDHGLRQSVASTYLLALKQGKWKPEEMEEIPFTLDFPEYIFSYAEHVRGITRACISAAKEFNNSYKTKRQYQVNMDLVIAGALLHDVGKLLEYERNGSGYFQITALGKLLRHPFSGAILAHECGCPDEVCHIIAVHAAEGDSSIRSPEAKIINKMDCLHYEIIRHLRQQ